MTCLLGVIAAVAGCSSSNGNSTRSTTDKGQSGAAVQGTVITIKGFAFGPATLKVTPGETVTVKNEDDTDHTVTAQDHSFDTGPIKGGTSKTFQVPASADIAYHCSIHDYMHGALSHS